MKHSLNALNHDKHRFENNNRSPCSLEHVFQALIFVETFTTVIGGGALGFSVLRIWPIFGSVFRFWCVVRFAGFLQFTSCDLAFGFRFLYTMRAVFGILVPKPFYRFTGFGKEVTPCSHANTNSKDHLQLQECMRSRRNCYQAARRKCAG